jgi:predicted DCC family thiol-disulfide oxidoreductase YuxK
VIHALVRLRWPIPLAIGFLALALAVAGNDQRPLSGVPLVWIALAGAALSTALYNGRSLVVRLLPDLSVNGLGLFRVAWALGLLHVLPFLRAAIHPAPFPRADQRNDAGVLDIGPAHWLASHPDVVRTIGDVTYAALILFAIGAFARLAYAVVAAGFAAHGMAAAMSQGLHDWGLPLVVILCLTAVPWGDGFGVDDVVRRLRGRPRRRRRSTYALAVWLPGFLLGTAWLAAAFAKLNHSGFAWISGGAVKYHFVSDARGAPVDWGLWIASHPTAAVVASAAGVLFEATFIFNVFFRNPLIRLGFGLSAASFFAGLYLFQGIRWEAWWILLLALLPWEPLAAGLRRLLPEYTVLVDSACPLCRRTARVLHGLDWFDRLTFVDANDEGERRRHAPSVDGKDALTHMIAVHKRRGTILRGCGAYLGISRSLPILAPLGLLVALPPIRSWAVRLYEGTASRRRRRCGEETCERGALPETLRQLVASSPRSLGVLPCILIAGVLVQQAVVSDRRIEKEPFLSNFPMYDFTYPSTREYDKTHLKLENFRFYRYDPTTRTRALLSPLNEISPEKGADGISQAFASVGQFNLVELARRRLLVKVFTKRLEESDVDPEQHADLLRLISGERTVSGESLTGLVLGAADEHRFDWQSGRFVTVQSGVALGVLNLATLELTKMGRD